MNILESAGEKMNEQEANKNEIDYKNALIHALIDFKDNSLNISSCDYYSWNRKWKHIEDLMEHL